MSRSSNRRSYLRCGILSVSMSSCCRCPASRIPTCIRSTILSLICWHTSTLSIRAAAIIWMAKSKLQISFRKSRGTYRSEAGSTAGCKAAHSGEFWPDRSKRGTAFPDHSRNQQPDGKSLRQRCCGQSYAADSGYSAEIR